MALSDKKAIEALLFGIEDKEHRELLLKSYQEVSQGDPNTFPVQFALMQKLFLATQQNYIEKFIAVAESLEKREKGGGVDVSLIAEKLCLQHPSSKEVKLLADSLRSSVSKINDLEVPKPIKSSPLMAVTFLLSLLNTVILAVFAYLWLTPKL